MFRKKRYIALALVAVVTLVLLNLPANTAARLRLAIGSQFLPLFGLANASQDAAGAVADFALSKRELIRQNNLLRQENAQLKLAATQAEEQIRENARLSQLIGWQQQVPWRMKLGRVVLRDPANWWRTVQIDLGSRDGIKPNMPVLTMQGLVGRVAAVGLTRSQVVLIGDPTCRVAALVENETRDSGVLGNAAPLERELIDINYLPSHSTVKPGQTVVTSDLGGTFPRGITIGKIVDVRQVEYGLATTARIKLAAALGSLEEVWVLTQWTR
ncbi:MAG TPA: rod shape-determining protein MreC [Verrucomicrobiae bacterium]|nr:rod shape-determining protein MreC [Verrucomicrobiae bacterium]